MVNSCMLVGGCRDRFLMHTPYRTLDRRRFGMRMVGMLLALSASCVFPLRLYASLPWTYNWLFSLMSSSCLGLRPSAAMTDGWFPPVQAVSSADLCNAFLEHHDRAFLLGARWRRLLLACVRFPSLWGGQPSAAAPEARWIVCWAGWLSWGLLRSTRGLAIWFQGWSASSVGETAPVAWSASGREPRCLHVTDIYTVIHCIVLHYTVGYIAFIYTDQHCTVPLYIVLHHIIHYIVLIYTVQHIAVVHYTAGYIALKYTVQHCTVLLYSVLHYTIHYIVLIYNVQYIAVLHYTVHYIALKFTVQQSTVLQYTVLHYIVHYIVLIYTVQHCTGLHHIVRYMALLIP